MKLFRLIALIEGVTTLALFFFAMPMKYAFGQPQYVPPIGMAHGVAVIAYILGMVVLLRNKDFSDADWLRTGAASLFPFGTFLNDPFLKRKQALASQ